MRTPDRAETASGRESEGSTCYVQFCTDARSSVQLTFLYVLLFRHGD